MTEPNVSREVAGTEPIEPEFTTPPGPDLLVGTHVLAFPGTREGRALVTRTRSAVVSIGGVPCVLVEGYAGGIALTHIEVIP